MRSSEEILDQRLCDSFLTEIDSAHWYRSIAFTFWVPAEKIALRLRANVILEIRWSTFGIKGLAPDGILVDRVLLIYGDVHEYWRKRLQRFGYGYESTGREIQLIGIDTPLLGNTCYDTDGKMEPGKLLVACRSFSLEPIPDYAGPEPDEWRIPGSRA